MKTAVKTNLIISSPSFHHRGFIPAKFTCEGEGINPALVIDHIPDQTRCLAIIMEDPDAPGETFDHWLIWNIPPVNEIPENSNPGLEGINSAGKIGYTGPCPPSGIHRYFFKIFAVDTLLETEKGATKRKLEYVLENHVIASGQIIGLYEKKIKH